MNTPQEVAGRIKDIAKIKKISVAEVLRECELSKNTLSSMLSAGCLPRLDAICKIADYLDVSIDYLIGRTDNPEINR